MQDPFLSRDHVGSIAARCGSDTLRLEAEWPTILQWVPRLGRVVAHTCNRDARVSQPGHFGRPAICSERRAFLGGDFVLSCRLDRWKSIFATIDDAGRRTLRIFDVGGYAIGSIDVDDPAGRPAFDEMVWRLHARDQSTREGVAADALPEPAIREDSLRGAGPSSARQISVDAVRAALASLGEHRGTVSFALANAGATHAYAGNVARFEGVARWTVAFASRATLTIDAASIARAWLVRTFHGPAPRNSIELFDRSGVSIVRFGYAGM
jgi:putative hemin transport protein